MIHSAVIPRMTTCGHR